MDERNDTVCAGAKRVSRLEINAILSTHFGEQGWEISKPKDGSQKESFIAQGQGRDLFIKFDVDPQPVKRLGEIGIAPPWLGSGTHNGRRFSIQQYIGGGYPRRQWLQQHLESLGRFFGRYHGDQQLRALLPKPSSESHRDFLAEEVQSLRECISNERIGLFKSLAVHQTFDEFRTQAEHLRESQLVPTHGDPSRKNFLLLNEQLFMIDWDELSISDPMRDAGPFLWWYASPHTWVEFLESYKEPLDQPNLDRIYWWSARQSLEVALWIARHEANPKEIESFLEDFKAGVAQQGNPHMSDTC